MTSPSKRGRVGYANPPEETRFKQGNTYGKRKRKRKATQFTPFEDFEAVLNHKIRVTINAQTWKVPIYEALLLRLRELANSGNYRAIKMIEKIRLALPEKFQPSPDDDWFGDLGIRTRLKLEALLAKAEREDEE